jgi:hypothetical protein
MHRYRWLLLSLAVAVAPFIPTRHPVRAAAPDTSPDPRPLPYQFVAGPGTGNPISTVDSFNGLAGVVAIHGTGTDNHGTRLDWEGDLRLTQGAYLGRDGVLRLGTFCFI